MEGVVYIKCVCKCWIFIRLGSTIYK